MGRRSIRIAARVLLCAGALALGAGIAFLTGPQPGAREDIARVTEDIAPPPPIDEPIDSAPTIASEIPPAPAPAPSSTIVDPFATTLRDGMVITGGTPHRLIMFTFDDGPDHRYTPGLLDTLDRLDLKAVFFLTTRRFEGNTPRERRLAEIAQDIVRRGHIVGSHTQDHIQLPTLTAAGLEEQIGGTERVFERVLGQRPWLVRPPGGGRSPRIDAWLAARGYTQVLWNVGTGDFQVRESEDVLQTFVRVLERRERENGERGGIVLLHDIHRWSVEAFPQIVQWLSDRNCELLADGEELYDIVDDPRAFFLARGEASPSDTAPPATPDAAWLDARQSVLRERAEGRCARLAMR